MGGDPHGYDHPFSHPPLSVMERIAAAGGRWVGDKKERVEIVLIEEILEIAIPRNFKKIGSSIRFGPVRGVVTCEKTGCGRSFCALWAQIVQPRCAGDPLKKPLDSQANNTIFS